MGVKHTHADLIKAWADGADIQHINMGGGSIWTTISKPTWDSPVSQYRIKPQPPKEPDYGSIARKAWYSAVPTAPYAACPEGWSSVRCAVIKAYQQYQEDMKVYQNAP